MRARLTRAIRRYLFEGEVLRLMGLTVLIKPLGMANQMLMANYFGAGILFDAYVLAYSLISFLNAIIGQVYSAAVIPLTIEFRLKLSPRELLAFQNASLMLFQIFVLVFLGSLFFLGDEFVRTVFPSLPIETRRNTVMMLRYLAVPGFLIQLVPLLQSVLNLNRSFRIAAIMPLLNGVIMIVVMVTLHGPLGIWCLPVGLGISFLAQTVILAAFAFHQRFLGWVRPHFPQRSLGRVWRLGSAVMITQGLLTLNRFIDKGFASKLEEGSISSIAYSDTLLHLATQLFGLSLVVVMFTRIAELVAEKQMAECGRYVRQNLKNLLRLVMPAALTAAVAAPEIVTVIFQRGEFDASDTARTAVALEFYMYGLPAMAVNRIIGRVFHALQRMRARMWLAVQYLATNTLGNWLLVDDLQVKGLAISSTLAITLHVALSLWILYRFHVGLSVGRIVRTVIHVYVLGGLTLLAYHLVGMDGLVGGFGSGKLAAAGSGSLKALFIFAVFGGLYGLVHLLERRWSGAR